MSDGEVRYLLRLPALQIPDRQNRPARRDHSSGQTLPNGALQQERVGRRPAPLRRPRPPSHFLPGGGFVGSHVGLLESAARHALRNRVLKAWWELLTAASPAGAAVSGT